MNADDTQILLVEDDDDHARLVTLMLARHRAGARVERVATADLALRRLAATAGRRPDVVLLDLKLPGMSGHELLEALRGEPATADLPVIILTTSDSDADRNRAATGRADGYLVKPIEPRLLTAALDRARSTPA